MSLKRHHSTLFGWLTGIFLPHSVDCPGHVKQQGTYQQSIVCIPETVWVGLKWFQILCIPPIEKFSFRSFLGFGVALVTAWPIECSRSDVLGLPCWVMQTLYLLPGPPGRFALGTLSYQVRSLAMWKGFETPGKSRYPGKPSLPVMLSKVPGIWVRLSWTF